MHSTCRLTARFAGQPWMGVGNELLTLIFHVLVSIFKLIRGYLIFTPLTNSNYICLIYFTKNKGLILNLPTSTGRKKQNLVSNNIQKWHFKYKSVQYSSSNSPSSFQGINLRFNEAIFLSYIGIILIRYKWLFASRWTCCDYTTKWKISWTE